MIQSQQKCSKHESVLDAYICMNQAFLNGWHQDLLIGMRLHHSKHQVSYDQAWSETFHFKRLSNPYFTSWPAQALPARAVEIDKIASTSPASRKRETSFDLLKGLSVLLWSNRIGSWSQQLCGDLSCFWVGEEQEPQTDSHKDLQHGTDSASFTILVMVASASPVCSLIDL